MASFVVSPFKTSDFRAIYGSVTITVEVTTNGATTWFRMNLSGYVGHVTWLNALYCVLFSSRVRVRVRSIFSVWLISDYAH